jgi:hypothetical protein
VLRCTGKVTASADPASHQEIPVLTSGAAQRMLVAAALVVALWLAVAWALS